jgi:tripartite-type tricarboxylate transporter receptor subunit TctC
MQRRVDQGGQSEAHGARRRGLAAAIAAGVLAARRPGAEEAWPARPLRLIMPFEAGGATDGIIRLFADALARELGRAVVVDNRPGAGGTIGMAQAARAAADGYTLVFVTGSMATAPALYRRLAYDALTDFQPIALFVRAPQVLVVHPALAAQSLGEFVALARAAPGRLDYGSGGNGTSSHIAFEMLRAHAGIDLQHVPFRGTHAALNAMTAGTVQAMIDTATTALPQARAGRLRALAVTPARRTPLAPTLPTIAESGLPGFDHGGWGGLLVPAATPAGIRGRLEQAVHRLAGLAELRQAFAEAGSELTFEPADAFARMFRAETERMRQLVERIGVRLD